MYFAFLLLYTYAHISIPLGSSDLILILQDTLHHGATMYTHGATMYTNLSHMTKQRWVRYQNLSDLLLISASKREL